MLKTYKSTFEIWDEDTNEILVDNLSFEDAAEQSLAYQQFFGDGVSVVIRQSSMAHTHKSFAQEYKKIWIDYFAELQMMGNLH